jgi:signal peptidase I
MMPTLQDGEFVLVNKMAYHIGSPTRGDIIVFQSTTERNLDLIKRVIGLPGDHIVIGGGKVTINGQTLNEPYIAAAPNYSGAWKVPDGYWFVLGDNRNDSSDSHVWGYLPIQNVIGKALLIYWPQPEWAMVDHIKIEVPAP